MNTEAQQKASYETLVNEMFQIPDKLFSGEKDHDRMTSTMKFEVRITAEVPLKFQSTMEMEVVALMQGRDFHPTVSYVSNVSAAPPRHIIYPS